MILFSINKLLLNHGDHYLNLLSNDLDCTHNDKNLLLLNYLNYTCSDNRATQVKIKEQVLTNNFNPLTKDLKEVTTLKDDHLQYFINNPGYGRFTALEQAIYSLCNTFNIIYTITTTDSAKKCISDLLYTITTKNLDECVISSLSITSYIQSCNYQVIISQEECKASYDILVTEVDDCNLSFRDYQRLISEGWTPLTISTLYSSNFTLTPNGKSIEYNSSIYPLDEICFSQPYVGSGEAKLFLEQVLKTVDIPQQIKDEIISS